MFDVVANHFGWAGAASTVDYADFTPFNQQSYFHSYCPITDADYSSNQTAVEDVSTLYKPKEIDSCLEADVWQCWIGDRYTSSSSVLGFH